MSVNILLELEQRELLSTLAKATRNVPADKREPITAFRPSGSCYYQISHPGLTGGKISPYMGDYQALIRENLIWDNDHSVEVSPLGYEYLRQSSVQGILKPAKTLIEISDEELEQRFTDSAEAALLSHNTYYEEIKRRSEMKHTAALVNLTKWTVIMAVVASLAAIASAVAAFLALKRP